MSDFTTTTITPPGTTPEQALLAVSQTFGAGLWVGGFPVLLDQDGALEDLILDSMGGSQWFAPQPVANRLLDRRLQRTLSYGSVGEAFPGSVQLQDRPALRLNQLYWPNGASRWAEMYCLMPAASVFSLLRYAWADFNVQPQTKTAYMPQYRARPIMMSWQYQSGPSPTPAVYAPMYVESARSLGTLDAPGQVNSQGYADTDLYLLHLVDARYWWQGIGFGCSPTGTPVATAAPDPFSKLPYRGRADVMTWSDLLTAISTQLQCPITFVNHSWWLKPSPDEFCRPCENIAHVLDAAAISLGSRVVRQLNGSVQLTYGEETLLQQWSNVRQSTIGVGEINMKAPPFFDYLMVAYPKCIAGHPKTYGQRYYWQLMSHCGARSISDFTSITPVDAENNDFSTDTTIKTAYGVPGTCHVVYSACHAWFADATETEPENYATLQNLTRAMMFDAVNWHYAQWEGDWEQLDAQRFVPIGSCDYHLIEFGVEGAPTYRLLTEGSRQTPRGAKPEPTAPPELVCLRQRRLKTRFQSVRTPPPRVNLCFDDTVPVVCEPYFKIVDNYAVHHLSPGSYAYADYVVWNTGTSTWDDADPALTDVKIYDPRHLACAMPDEVVHCRWSDERDRWEVDEPYGLHRKAIVKSVAGIPAGGSGSVEIYHNDSPTSLTVTAHLIWMDMGQSIAYGKEIYIHHDSGEERWWIPGAECPGGSSGGSLVP